MKRLLLSLAAVALLPANIGLAGPRRTTAPQAKPGWTAVASNGWRGTCSHTAQDVRDGDSAALTHAVAAAGLSDIRTPYAVTSKPWAIDNGGARAPMTVTDGKIGYDAQPASDLARGFAIKVAGVDAASVTGATIHTWFDGTTGEGRGATVLEGANKAVVHYYSVDQQN